MAARPATRRADAAPERAARPSVRDFTAGAGGQVIEFDVRTAYDFVFSLAADAGSTDDLAPEDQRWLTEARDALPAEIREAAVRLFQSEWCVQAGAFVVEHPEARTAAQLVTAVEAARPAELLRCAFGELVHGESNLVDRALSGEPAAVAELEQLLPTEHHATWVAMLHDPAATYRQVAAVLRAWSGPFSQIEDRVAAILKRDVERRAGDRATLAVPDLIERTTGGVRWLPEARIRRVILAPSYFSRPYNYVLGADDWRLFGYPVADDALEGLDPLAPPPAVVRLHRALGDTTRLRILKLLSKNDYYLTELAQLLELSKPTIKHHLAQLRAAGLITAIESGSVIYYTLRRARLDDASAGLKGFLAD